MQKAQQLGRYHLLDRLAYGGMAEIYRAQTFDGKGRVHFVAVKRVLAHLAEDADFIQMMVDEASIASSLRHPNIARVYEFARSGHEYFIAMEHVDGKDLRTILERCRQTKLSLAPKHVAFIAAEAAAALHAAHAAVDSRGEPLRIIHRDVSPSNILVSYSGDVKLCDFGIAKATLSKVHTKTGVIKGKVKYMSPEQALGRKLDHRTDIFSLGSVIYEMLTRAAPFIAAGEMDLLIKVRDAKYQPISELAPAVPPELEAICDKCLARSRSERYQTAAELERDLQAFLRKYLPGYNRSHLAHYMREAFASEIERELRMQEEFVLSEEVSDDVGENLIVRAAGHADVPFLPRPGQLPLATPLSLPTPAAPQRRANPVATAAMAHPNTLRKPATAEAPVQRVTSLVPRAGLKRPSAPVTVVEPVQQSQEVFESLPTHVDASPFLERAGGVEPQRHDETTIDESAPHHDVPPRPRPRPRPAAPPSQPRIPKARAKTTRSRTRRPSEVHGEPTMILERTRKPK